MTDCACTIGFLPRTAVTSRRSLRTTGIGISGHKGFTVIELMTTIGVLAIITSLALPSYRTLLEKRQVTSGAEQIGAFLSSAQLESVKRNQFVAVNYEENGGAWCLGIRAEDPEGGDPATVDCDCRVTDASSESACALDGALKVFNSSVLNYPEVLQSVAVGGDITDSLIVVYDPVRGLLQDPEIVTIALQSEDSSYALDVEVTITGRIKICSNTAADKDVPGYKECLG